MTLALDHETLITLNDAIGFGLFAARVFVGIMVFTLICRAFFGPPPAM